MRQVDSNGRLYVSSYEGYKELEENQIDTVVNLSSKCSSTYSKPRSYFHLPIRDDNKCRYRDFRQATELVLNRYRRNVEEEILVHCAAGQSRSVSVAAAAVSVLEGRRFEEVVREAQDGQIAPVSVMEGYGERFVEESKG